MSESAGGEWACNICYQKNMPEVGKCVVCGRAKGYVPAPASSSEDDEQSEEGVPPAASAANRGLLASAAKATIASERMMLSHKKTRGGHVKLQTTLARGKIKEWYVGDWVQVDTEDGLEIAVILGASESGDASELNVKFADGVIDDWDAADFKKKWYKGQTIDVDTEDGLEEGAEILGPPVGPDQSEMQVRFADGVIDDWPVAEFRRQSGDALDDAEEEVELDSYGRPPPPTYEDIIAPSRSALTARVVEGEIKEWTSLGHPRLYKHEAFEPDSLQVWLKDLKIKRWEHYAALLAAERCEVADLVFLQDEDFKKMGVSAIGPRGRMVRSCRSYEESRETRAVKQKEHEKKKAAEKELEKLRVIDLHS